jgi:hypothetical protein
MGLSGGTWARMRDAWMEVVEEQGGQTGALQRQVSEVTAAHRFLPPTKIMNTIFLVLDYTQ